MKDIRDAFILWLAGNASFIIGSTFASYADAWPLPLQISMVGAAITFYLAGAGLLSLGGISAVAGFKAIRR